MWCNTYGRCHILLGLHCLPHPRPSVKSTKVVYGTNPCMPIDLILIPWNKMLGYKAKKHAEVMKKLHEQVREKIERSNQLYKERANKHRKQPVFEPGTWFGCIWGRRGIPISAKHKLMPRSDEPFRVVQRVGESAYKLDLPEEYNVSGTFDVWWPGSLHFRRRRYAGTTSFQEGENDAGASSVYQEALMLSFEAMQLFLGNRDLMPISWVQVPVGLNLVNWVGIEF